MAMLHDKVAETVNQLIIAMGSNYKHDAASMAAIIEVVLQAFEDLLDEAQGRFTVGGDE